jgi:hypothetical protein
MNAAPMLVERHERGIHVVWMDGRGGMDVAFAS